MHPPLYRGCWPSCGTTSWRWNCWVKSGLQGSSGTAPPLNPPSSCAQRIITALRMLSLFSVKAEPGQGWLWGAPIISLGPCCSTRHPYLLPAPGSGSLSCPSNQNGV